MVKVLLFVGISVMYLILTILLMNSSLVGLTIFGDYPLSYKLQLLYDLISGVQATMTTQSLVILLLTASLVGINLTLIVARAVALRNQGHMRLVVGGSSLLGIAGSGCAACGLPVLSVFGLSGGALSLPFKGQELSIGSLVMLLISLYFLLQTRVLRQACEIPQPES